MRRKKRDSIREEELSCCAPVEGAAEKTLESVIDQEVVGGGEIERRMPCWVEKKQD